MLNAPMEKNCVDHYVWISYCIFAKKNNHLYNDSLISKTLIHAII